MRILSLILACALLTGCSASAPVAQEPAGLPVARWDHRPNGAVWTKAALAALQSHGQPLLQAVPADIARLCPAYEAAGPKGRSAFWVGFLSALSKHESTYRAEAVGGGGLWFGLVQIAPATARGYGCRAGSGAALKDGAANLSCAVRIMSVTVPRDGVIGASGRGGVAADWGPMTQRSKREDIIAWTRQQSYCQP